MSEARCQVVWLIAVDEMLVVWHMQAAGLATDHATYLLPSGTADIFFPTDFQMLERMYSTVARTGGLNAGGHLLKPALSSTLFAWLQPVAVKSRAHTADLLLCGMLRCTEQRDKEQGIHEALRQPSRDHLQWRVQSAAAGFQEHIILYWPEI